LPYSIEYSPDAEDHLRFLIGTLRVYYDVEDTPEPKVYIRAVGIKERNRVRIAGAIFEL
jgi:hypothetical protein